MQGARRTSTSRVVIVCDLAKTFLRFRMPLALAIQGSGHEVHVVFSSATEEEIRRVEDDGLQAYVVGTERTRISPWRDARYLRHLRRLLQQLGPSTLLSYQIKVAALACIAARGVPGCRRFVLFPGLGVLVDAGAFAGIGGVVRRLAVAVFRRAFSGIDGVLVQNPDDHATLLGLRIIHPSTRYEIVNGSGVSLAEFCAEPRLEVPVRFLMAGRLLATKGFREFVAAARQLREERSAEVEFQIAGGLDHHPSAISGGELEAWTSDGHITYLGEVTDIRPYLHEASVFVLPSYYGEGTPRVILEAMAMSRPVITADSRGCREAVVEGETGRVVPPRDVEALAAAMDFYVGNHAAIASHGVAGRALAVDKYDVETVVQSMVRFLELDGR